MSACCSNYPNCKCGDNPLSYSESQELLNGLLREEDKRIFESENIKYTRDHVGFGKQRNKMTHLIPKKKKRK